MKSQKVSVFLYSAAGLAVFILCWHLLVCFTGVGQIFPSPFAVLRRFVDVSGRKIGKCMLYSHLGFSLLRVTMGYLIAAAMGILVGLIMAGSKMGNAIIRPLFAMIRPIPGITWMPLFILWFGTGWVTQIGIIFVAGFSHMVLNTYAGATRVDPKLVGAARMLGANNTQVFYKVILPSSVPYIFSGLQVALSSCWMAVPAAEMMSATEGIGWMIVSGQDNGDIEQVLVGVIIISIIGLVLANTMRGVETKLCAWSVRGR